MRAVVCALLVLLLPDPASAQYVDLTEPDPFAERLADVRLSIHAERREAGIALIAGGLLSVLGGGIIAATEHADPFWLAFGIGTAGWGAVNSALAIGILDISGGGFARIERDRWLRGEELARSREQALSRQRAAETLFGFNLGLDVFYVATGVLAFFLADELHGAQAQQLLRGYAVAQLSQGAFLFAFDLVEWIGSAMRAERVAGLEPSR